MVTLPRLEPTTLDFVLLSFEGPDQYSMAGGLGVRMKELALELARQGHKTHLVFVGDPHLPAQESPAENLTLHRWGQWLSAHYPGGVYSGEEAKLVDWNEQLPAFVTSKLVAPAAAEGRLTAILAEEWHTAYVTCQISDRLWAEGLRDKTVILWNANNVMGFDRIDWRRLDFCSQITTVSRYMKHVMWDKGVNPLVIPNGIPSDRIRVADKGSVERLRAAFPDREIIFKIGRFSPDKRWHMAVNAVAEEKTRGHEAAMIIRGGVEPHGLEVIANARDRGLAVVDLSPPRDAGEALAAFAEAPRADVYNITSFMSDELISILYSGADAVLANSGHEPFGLVGLEVMGAGGIAFVGSTGEDYAVPFLNSVVLDTDDPSEINIALDVLRRHPEVAARMREDGQETARNFTWENVILDSLLGKLEYVCLRQLVAPPSDSSGAVDETPTPKGGAGKGEAAKKRGSSPQDKVGGPLAASNAGAAGAANPGGPAAPAATPAASTGTVADPAADDPPQTSDSDAAPAYGGAATTCRLTVKPQMADECSGQTEASGDPAPPRPSAQPSAEAPAGAAAKGATKPSPKASAGTPAKAHTKAAKTNAPKAPPKSPRSSKSRDSKA